MNRYSWRPAVLAALCGGALASPVLGDELLGMQSDQNTYLSGVVRGNFPDLNHNTAVGINTAPWRIDTALPIGADLFLFGGNGSDQQFWVIGRTPQDPTQQNYEG